MGSLVNEPARAGTPVSFQGNNQDHYYRKTIDNSAKLKLAYENGCRNFEIVVVSPNGVLPRNKPQRLSKEIKEKIKNHEKIGNLFFTRSNRIIIKTESLECAQQATDIQLLMDFPVVSSPQHECFTSRFLLKDMPSDIPVADIVEEIEWSNKNVKVLEARRFLRSVDYNRAPTNLVLVTILGTQSPKEIKTWYSIQKVSEFVDRPRQCRRCFKFNHSEKTCQNDLTCQQCGAAERHEKCMADPKCSNCLEAHKANDKSCPAWKQEEKFLEFKTRNHLSFSEARKRFLAAPVNDLYANKAKSTSQSSTESVFHSSQSQINATEFNKLCECVSRLIIQQEATNEKIDKLFSYLEATGKKSKSGLDRYSSQESPVNSFNKQAEVAKGRSGEKTSKHYNENANKRPKVSVSNNLQMYPEIKPNYTPEDQMDLSASGVLLDPGPKGQ